MLNETSKFFLVYIFFTKRLKPTKTVYEIILGTLMSSLLRNSPSATNNINLA